MLELSPRRDGPRYRRVTLAVANDGSLVLHAHEMGGNLEAAWGVDDDEATLSVPSDQLGRLALALAAEVLKGGDDALARLSGICEAHDVRCRIAHWT